MSLPETAEYWNDVKRYFREGGGGNYEPKEPKLHFPAPGVTLEPRPGHDREPEWETTCGKFLARDRLRSKKGKVTCRGCLVKICRFVVTHKVGDANKILVATDDANVAQENFYQAQDNKLIGVVLSDRMAADQCKNSSSGPR